MTGKKRSRVGLVQYAVTLPEGVYREMEQLVERERRWDGRVEFTREAVREKIEREKAKPARPSAEAVAMVRNARPP